MIERINERFRVLDGVLCENSDHGLRGLAVVELEQAAKLLMALHRAGARQRCFWCDELVAQTLVRPFLVIMIHKRAHSGAEVRFAEWHDAVQALRLDG